MLKQAEANDLIAMEKYRINDEMYRFPAVQSSLAIPLHSADDREQFLLDINRYGSIDLKKVTMQNRARKSIVLVRVDLAGPPHRNPDDEDIPTPHIHTYREGYGDKWAEPLPAGFGDAGDISKIYAGFLRYCNITRPPIMQMNLFV